MLKTILLPSIFVLLGYGFWLSPDFKITCSGIAIFLFGMLSLEAGFKRFSGGTLEKVLSFSTDKVWKSVGFGMLTTTLMQSSTLVSLITISFLSAGLIQLVQGIGIIFGANIGTTTGAWLVAAYGLKVNISAYAMPLLTFAMILVLQRGKSLKGLGYILAGIGFLFLGIHYVKEGFEAFRGSVDLADYSMHGIRGLLIFTLIGILITVITQSSHATLLLIITALATQQLSYENALALAIGANIGTTITAVFGAMGSNINGKRLAGAHVIFNLTTGALAIIFIQPLMASVEQISTYLGIAPDNYSLKLCLFHTLFNLMGVIIMLPFIHTLTRILTENVNPRNTEPVRESQLNESVLAYPDAALQAFKNEVNHFYNDCCTVISQGLFIPHLNNLKAVLPKQPDDVDALYQAQIRDQFNSLIRFSAEAQGQMNPGQSEVLFSLKLASREMLNSVKAAKHLQKNMLKHLDSPNPYVKGLYREILTRLENLLTKLDEIEQLEDEEELLHQLSKLKLNQGKEDLLTNGTLDTLIRKQKIPGSLSTSLLNDSYYASNIAHHLTQVAEVLFTTNRRLHSELSLDQNDINEILEQGKMEIAHHEKEQAG